MSMLDDLKKAVFELTTAAYFKSKIKNPLQVWQRAPEDIGPNLKWEDVPLDQETSLLFRDGFLYRKKPDERVANTHEKLKAQWKDDQENVPIWRYRKLRTAITGQEDWEVLPAGESPGWYSTYEYERIPTPKDLRIKELEEYIEKNGGFNDVMYLSGKKHVINLDEINKFERSGTIDKHSNAGIAIKFTFPDL